jgi:protein-tyrosine phosphatase
VVDEEAPTLDQVIGFLKLVTTSDKPVFVHCLQGEGRTGTFVAAYRMAQENWSLDRAIAEAKVYHLEKQTQIDFLTQFDSDLTDSKVPGFGSAK